MVRRFNFVEWDGGDYTRAINRHQHLHEAVRARRRNGAGQGKRKSSPGINGQSLQCRRVEVRATIPEPLTDIDLSMKQSELEGVMARSRG
ncbi:hypothetical protein CDAR_177271 [Caerostris darwini]|uniref:Uncharacterized protein n=1 Tax=Caerostris darwini TaxID=1538125 RepID=A0AAV4TRG2_9ARAC|nr:hypothetical protein CDAR_177271 [Caerostris darwini]